MSDGNAAASETRDPANEYINDIMRREEELAQELPPRSPKTRLPMVLFLLPIAIGLTTWNVLQSIEETEVFTPEEEIASAQFTIYLAASSIESFRDSTGSLPEGLYVVDADDDGITYLPNTSTYALSASVADQHITYKAGDDLAPYQRAFDVLTVEND